VAAGPSVVLQPAKSGTVAWTFLSAPAAAAATSTNCWVSPSAPLLYSRPLSPPPYSPASESGGSDCEAAVSLCGGPRSASSQVRTQQDCRPSTLFPADALLTAEHDAASASSLFDHLLSWISAGARQVPDAGVAAAAAASPDALFAAADDAITCDSQSLGVPTLPPAPSSAETWCSAATITTAAIPAAAAAQAKRRPRPLRRAKQNTRLMVQRTDELLRRNTDLLAEYQLRG
jgi:hypothetical protein